MYQSMTQLSNQKPVVSTFDSLSINSAEPSQIRNPQSPIRNFLFLLFTSHFLLLTSCEKQTTPVQPPTPQLTLTAEAGVIEAWLTITTEETEGAELLLTRDGAERLRFAAVAETTVVDTGLLPAHTYTYTAQLLKNGQTAARSASVEITTMDTTSHDFQWEVFTFGTGGSSYLRDVAIISPDNIWCVGKINAGGGPYNAVHWDGQQWELKRIQVFYNGSYITPVLDGIFAFSENDLWVTSGVPKHWNGSIWTQYHLWDMGVLTQEDGGVTKIWGSSPNDVYFVGRKGTIVHYNGSSWQKIESGTDVMLTDIWGTPEGSEVWACGWNWDAKSILLRKNENQWEMLWFNQNPTPPWVYTGWLNSLWTPGTINFMVAGGHVFRHSLLDLTDIRREPITLQNFSYRIRGSGHNNIALSGDFAMLWHYNGITWRYYHELLNENDRIYSLDVSENIIISVGRRYNDILSDALIIIGRR